MVSFMTSLHNRQLRLRKSFSEHLQHANSRNFVATSEIGWLRSRGCLAVMHYGERHILSGTNFKELNRPGNSRREEWPVSVYG